MIEVDKLNLSIGNAKVLQEIDIIIRPYKITSILGPNGAGKTSLLKCLSGARIPYTGSIKLNEHLLSDYSLIELAKQRAVLSQSNPVTFPFTTMEIVMMGRNPYLNESNIKTDVEIAEYLLNQVDAYHFKDRLFPTLSGGEQQRVQLARVLAQIWEKKNTVLFLDEPTSALDIRHQHQILQLSKKLVEEKSMTIICILHDLNLTKYYSDNAILMLNGKIHSSGNTNEVLSAKNLEYVYQLPKNIIERFHLNKQTVLAS